MKFWTVGERVGRVIFRLSVAHPTYAALLLIRILLLVVWIRGSEVSAVFDLFVNKVTYGIPPKFQIAASDIPWPAWAFIAKVAGAYFLPFFVMAVMDAVFFGAFVDRNAVIPAAELANTLKETRDFIKLLRESLRIEKVFVHDPKKMFLQQSHVAAIRSAFEACVSDRRPIRILTLSGSHLIGYRENSVLWSSIASLKPDLKVILMDPLAAGVIDRRLEDIHGRPAKDLERQLYASECGETIEELRRLKQANKNIEVFTTQMPYLLHLLVMGRTLFCATVEPGSRLDKSPWYLFVSDGDRFTFAAALERLVEAVKITGKRVI